MFFTSGSKSINKKWNINDFVIGGNRTRSTTETTKDENDLNASIKKIESLFSRGVSDLDSLYKDIKNKRKEIRARFLALESDPENEAVFHKMDVDLIQSQIKVVESKVKMGADKFKQIRDEKKLLQDKNPKASEATTTVVVEQNNPLSNIAPSSKPQVYRAPMLDPSMIRSKSKVESIVESTIESEKEQGPIPSSEGADTGVAHSTPYKGDSVVTKETWMGDTLETMSDLDRKRAERVAKRLNSEEDIYKDLKSVQGIDYERSIKSIVNKGKDLHKKMFINVEDGTYYVRTYETDDNNNEILCPTEQFQSILHIGAPEFNTRNKTVKTQYEDETIPYEIVYGDDDMPNYYRDSWTEPANRRFKLDHEVLETL